MAYVTASGVPSQASVYAPELWATELLREFYTRTVFSEIANTNYEGQIEKQGCSVHIPDLPDITIRDHAIGQKLTYEFPEPADTELLIDKGKYYGFVIDSVQKKQSAYDYMLKWAEKAGKKMKKAIDVDVLANAYGSVHASNAGLTAGAKSSSYNIGVTGTPVALTKTNIVDYIVDCGSVLEEQDIPVEEGCFMVLPVCATGLIRKSDLKDASMTGDGKSLTRTGRLGMIYPFTIYASNNLATSADGGYNCWNAIFGHKDGLTFASQLTENEIIPNPNGFGKLCRGLQVYGYKVTIPKALGHFYFRKA